MLNIYIYDVTGTEIVHSSIVIQTRNYWFRRKWV